MGSITLWQILLVILTWFPAVHVLISKRSHGGAKFAWFLITAFTSWIGYVVFLIVTQKNKDKLAE
ncbi:MAG: hypothetical protein ACTJGW_15635 [Vibrio casei]|uniref:hypothetical protein n=1 Tax=Vibrio casei TaxID=673372 RepID=UPI000B5C96DB|nr:hypothetical protein [Vibrio sp.]